MDLVYSDYLIAIEASHCTAFLVHFVRVTSAAWMNTYLH